MSSPPAPPPSSSVYATWRRPRAASITSHDSSLLNGLRSGGRDRSHSSASRPQQGLQQPSGALSQLADPRLSSSLTSTSHREPIRSFINAATRDNIASATTAQYARSVREETAELATYQLTDKAERRSPSFLHRRRSLSIHTNPLSDVDADDASSRTSGGPAGPTGPTAPNSGRGGSSEPVEEPILEASEPSRTPSPEEEPSPSLLTQALRRSPPESFATSHTHLPPGSVPDSSHVNRHKNNSHDDNDGNDDEDGRAVFSDGDDFEIEDAVPTLRVSDTWHSRVPDIPGPPPEEAAEAAEAAAPQKAASKTAPKTAPTEYTPLLNGVQPAVDNYGIGYDLEGQTYPFHKRLRNLFKWPLAKTKRAASEAVEVGRVAAPDGPRVHPVAHAYQSFKHLPCWDRHVLWKNAVVAPVACLPAVIVGLLLNILDALSYGMILFPLGSPIFAHLGSAGISIFYVSTIVAQLTFSSGSIFRGCVGSELIEVVPFFHSMATTITGLVGEDKPDAVIATTIVSYALSAMVTGSVFYLMGRFRFGYIVGFIPRHILIGCIGGVGWFLVATGFEVTARIEGSLEYNLDTLHKLIQLDTIPLWTTPLVLSLLLFWGQKYLTSKYFLPLYIIAIPFLFYFFELVTGPFSPSTLRKHGWVFEGPPAGEPWWYFYTLYKFHLVDWGAIVQCIPAMFALTFFGILHVPINVPALALNTGEDHADLNHELKLHGYSNFLSGCIGSIQNYLVYANTLFFMRSGGDSRLAGVELAFLTFCVMLIGPKIIGFIPVMMVGCLIFDLGFELLVEAVWEPRKKLKLPEYITVITIVLIMGIYDFVVGIGVGVLLAFVSMIFQTSQVSAVRASYSGEMVNSTVRRNPSQQQYIRQVGGQICIIKLAGFLFFGTIVSVESTIRQLIAEDAFNQRPIRFLILDLRQVTGLDYSAGEAFNTISRLADSKGIHLVISSVDTESALGHDLRAVGLGEDDIEVAFLPNINTALELCENELLKTLYASEEEAEIAHSAPTPTGTADPNLTATNNNNNNSLLSSSPRIQHLRVAAQESLQESRLRQQQRRWQNFSEPLKLMLQIFADVSDKNEDFWFRAVRYFVRREYAAGEQLFAAGAPAQGFYLVESGILRAEYALAHGQGYHESIVAGTTCGELPFFSETNRTATTSADMDCVVWVMDRNSWQQLQRDDPDVASELLRISLKLTAERMLTVPSSTMLMAD